MAEKAEKLTRKELKAPDEFQKIGAQAVPFLVAHQKNVLIGIGIAIVVGGVVAMSNYFSERKELAAKQDLGTALKSLQREVKTAEPTDTDASGADQPYKSEADKLDAEIAALTNFRAKHAGTKVASNSGLALGEVYLKKGSNTEAIAAFDDYLGHSDPSDPLRPAALEGKGYALEASKQYDQALSAFDQLAQETKTDFMKGMGLYHRGRILLLQGKTDEGAKALSQVPSLAPNSAAARLAQERITTLIAQGVNVPAPPPPTPMMAFDAG